jgi:hypothetical protein
VASALGASWQKAELGNAPPRVPELSEGRPRAPELDGRDRPAATAVELRGSEARQLSELDPDAVPTTTFDLEACIRGPHELAPVDGFEWLPGPGLEGPSRLSTEGFR